MGFPPQRFHEQGRGAMIDPINEAEARWKISLKHATGDEYMGPCPFCHDGEDRFHVWADRQNYWCRQCGVKGFLDEEDGREFTEQELTELRLRALERKVEKHERQLNALGRMMASTDHITYHKLLDDSDRAYWHSQGIYDKAIDEYMLGVCYNCPTAPRQASYTIPVFDSTWTKLLNIRHRLIDATTGDRYRPHIAGLPGKLLFNARWTKEHDELLLVEGEKKSIVVSSQVMPAVGILGASGFDMRWLPHFASVKKLYIALDPDVQDKALVLGTEIAKHSRIDVRMCTFPVKPDDFFLKGGKPGEFKDFLKWAKPVN